METAETAQLIRGGIVQKFETKACLWHPQHKVIRSFLSPPSIIFHDKSGHRLDRFLFKDKTLALIPAPRLFIFAHAAQRNFIRQLLAREREQLPPEVPTLIFRRDEQLVE